MAQVVHVECPVCRAPIGLFELSRIVVCAHCESKLVVDGHAFIPEYYLEPTLDSVAARRALQRALIGDNMPDGLLKNSRLHSARLHFIPYNQLTARRMGTVVLKERPPGASAPRTETETDTRVIMTDIERTEPAVTLPDWALDQAAICNSATHAPGALLPATRSELARKGRISAPSVSPEQLLASLASSHLAAAFEDHTEFVEKRICRVFYPVWRVRYRFQNRLYWATLDGVTGHIMGLRAPQDDRQRLKWMLGSTMLFSFIAGKILRLIVLAGAYGGMEAVLTLLGIAPALLAVFFVIGVCLSLAAMVVAWEQFRYPGELVQKGREVEVVKLKPPGENRVLLWMWKAMEQLEKATSAKGSRWP